MPPTTDHKLEARLLLPRHRHISSPDPADPYDVSEVDAQSRFEQPLFFPATVTSVMPGAIFPVICRLHPRSHHLRRCDRRSLRQLVICTEVPSPQIPPISPYYTSYQISCKRDWSRSEKSIAADLGILGTNEDEIMVIDTSPSLASPTPSQTFLHHPAVPCIDLGQDGPDLALRMASRDKGQWRLGVGLTRRRGHRDDELEQEALTGVKYSNR